MPRVKDPSDPRRCRGKAPDGQCMNRAEIGQDYCRYHGGHSTKEEIDMRGFLLAKAEDRIRLAELDGLEPIRELHDVMKMTHMLIERRWNAAMKSETEMIVASPALNQLYLTMERLVASSHRIEQNLGALLARNAIFRLAQTIISIISDELVGIDNYEIVVDSITRRIVEAIKDSNNTVTVTAQAALPPPDYNTEA